MKDEWCCYHVLIEVLSLAEREERCNSGREGREMQQRPRGKRDATAAHLQPCNPPSI
jgi:hypothetical protein